MSFWAASTEDKAEEVVTEEDRNRWDATGLETKSGHVWMSDEQTKDPEWDENMDQAEMDWAEALARESIEKQDDPLLTLTLTLTNLNPNLNPNPTLSLTLTLTLTRTTRWRSSTAASTRSRRSRATSTTSGAWRTASPR